MGYDTTTRRTTNYSNSLFYEEAEGTAPDGTVRVTCLWPGIAIAPIAAVRTTVRTPPRTPGVRRRS